MKTKETYLTPHCKEVNLVYENCVLSNSGGSCESDDGGMEEGGEV